MLISDRSPDRSEDTQSGNFCFSVSFFSFSFFPFCFRKMTRSRSSSPAPCGIIYLFSSPAMTPSSSSSSSSSSQASSWKYSRFASVATVCLEVGPSAVKHHCFFLEYYTAMLSYLESDRSSPEVGDASSKSSCRHFSLPWYTLYVNVKLSKACAELKITYQLYGLSIRNPIRKVRIAEPLYRHDLLLYIPATVRSDVEERVAEEFV